MVYFGPHGLHATWWNKDTNDEEGYVRWRAKVIA